MKKRYLFFLLLILLVGCSNINVNKNNLITKLDTKFNYMLEISELELKNYYGIDTDKFIDYTFKISYNDPKNIYVIVLPKNKKEAKKEIDKFFEKQMNLSNETNKKRIKNKYNNNFGDYLFYIVSDNNKEIYKELNNYLKAE